MGASQVIDEVILPNMLFMSKTDIRKSMKLLESLGNAISPMGSAVYDLFDLSKHIRSLNFADSEAIEGDLPAFLNLTQEIENSLVAWRNENETNCGEGCLRSWNALESVPMSSMLVEAL